MKKREKLPVCDFIQDIKGVQKKCVFFLFASNFFNFHAISAAISLEVLTLENVVIIVRIVRTTALI